MAGDLSAFAVNTYSYTLTHSACECVGHLAGLGFRELELMIYPRHLWPPELNGRALARLRASLKSEGMRIVTFNMPNIDINVAAASTEMREHSLELLISTIELAGDLGVAQVIIGPGKANPLLPMPIEQLKGHFFRALDRLTRAAAKANTSLLIENMPFAFLPRMRELSEALDAYGDDSLGVVFDVANSHFVKEDMTAALRCCRDRLKIVHVSDTDQVVYRHAPVGEGTVDFSPLPKLLEDLGLRPQLTLEIVSERPDTEIRESALHLLDTGWGAVAGHPA